MKIGQNAYKIDLLDTYGVSNTFNIGDLSHYEDNTELGTILLSEGGNDPITTANSQARTTMGDYNWTDESKTRAFDTDALTELSMH